MDTSQLKVFAEEIIKEAGADNLDPEIIEEMKSDIIKGAERAINKSLLAQLPDSKLDEFDKLLDLEDKKLLMDFLKDNITNIPEVVASGLLLFRESYLLNYKS